MSESDTVAVPVESSEGPDEVEVPAAAEAVVVAAIEADESPAADDSPRVEAEGSSPAEEESSPAEEESSRAEEESSAVEPE